jgi:Protein of unknown function (DUF2845)
MKSVWMACALLVATAAAIGDGYYRCGSWLVSAESSVADLLKKCGEPASKQVSTEDVFGYYGQKTGTTRIETWRYDRGSRAAPMIVTVIDGKIDKIEGGPGAPQQPE